MDIMPYQTPKSWLPYIKLSGSWHDTVLPPLLDQALRDTPSCIVRPWRGQSSFSEIVLSLPRYIPEGYAVLSWGSSEPTGEHEMSFLDHEFALAAYRALLGLVVYLLRYQESQGHYAIRDH